MADLYNVPVDAWCELWPGFRVRIRGFAVLEADTADTSAQTGEIAPLADAVGPAQQILSPEDVDHIRAMQLASEMRAVRLATGATDETEEAEAPCPQATPRRPRRPRVKGA